jgi:phytoene desaturase
MPKHHNKKVIIVGAGPGGLAAAINLASLGVKVEVLEKHSGPGGRMRGFDQDGFRFDTGPTILQLPQLVHALFKRAGKNLEDYVTLKRLDPNTRIHFWDHTQLNTMSDESAMANELAKLNPKHQASFEKWMKVSKEKYAVAYEKFISTPADSLGYYAPWRLFETLKFKPWQSLYSHLNSFFHDDRVNYAFSYPSKYLGLHPTTCSSVFGVIPFIELQFGVWHVMGGFRSLATGMQKCAEDLGVTFRFNCSVSKVNVTNQVTTGVTLESGEVVNADTLVVNADLPYAAQSLIANDTRKNTRLSNRSLEKAQYSCSTFMLYLGLNKRFDELPHHLIYLSNAARRTDANALNDVAVDLEDPPFYVSNATPTDASNAPNGNSAIYVLVPTPNTSRNVDWKDVEAKLSARVPGWLAKVGMHDVAKHIVTQRAFTAETWRDDFNVFRGAVFNLSHTWLQLGPLRPNVKSSNIDNLYWVGGGTHPGSGLLTIFESANIAGDFMAKEIGLPGLPNWPFVPPAV